MNRQALLLVSRRDLIEAFASPEADQVIRSLAGLTQQGYQLVATANQPDEWTKNNAVSRRSKPGPKRLRDRLAEAGGVLDGVYYIPQSLLTQRTKREEALKDLMARFGLQADACHLVSSNRKLISVAESLGINTYKINGKEGLQALLATLRK